MKRVAIIGGIGSGKSTVGKLFEVLNVPVFKTDDAAKKIRENNIEVKMSLVNMYGIDCMKDGIIDVKFLADKIFSDKVECDKVTKLFSPYIMEAYNTFCEANSHAAYTLFETAIADSFDLLNNFDYIIAVVSTTEKKIARVMLRSVITEKEVKQRMANLQSDKVMIKISDFVITNLISNDPASLLEQVLPIHKKILTTRC
jgi:dephospho-CoA kinase